MADTKDTPLIRESKESLKYTSRDPDELMIEIRTKHGVRVTMTAAQYSKIQHKEQYETIRLF